MVLTCVNVFKIVDGMMRCSGLSFQIPVNKIKMKSSGNGKVAVQFCTSIVTRFEHGRHRFQRISK